MSKYNDLWRNISHIHQQVNFLEIQLCGGRELWKVKDQVHLSLIGLPQVMCQIYQHSTKCLEKLKKNVKKEGLKPKPTPRHYAFVTTRLWSFQPAKDHEVWSIQLR